MKAFDQIDDAIRHLELPADSDPTLPMYSCCIITRGAAEQFLERFYANGIDEHHCGLMRELLDERDQDDKDNAIEFTDVQAGDIEEGRSIKSFVAFYELWQLWRR